MSTLDLEEGCAGPKIMPFDEPISALDPELAKEVFDTISL